MLEIERLNVFIGSVHAVRNATLSCKKGEIVCIIGPNGAGKTSTLKGIIGLLPAKADKLLFEGINILKMPPHKRVRLGIGFSPEDRRLYPELTVEENVLMPTYVMNFRKDTVEHIKKEVFNIFPMLNRLWKRKGIQLSGGEQKMVAIARALAYNPKLVLLDEPFEGLMPRLRTSLAEGIRLMKERGIAMLIAESSFTEVLQFADKIYKIERGEISKI